MHYRLPSSEDRKYIHLRFAENGGPLTSQVAGRDVTPPAPSTPEYQIWYFKVKNELYSPSAFQRAIAHVFVAIGSG